MVKRWNEKYNDTRAAILSQYKYSAKKRNITFVLTDEQFYETIQKPCSYCGREKTNVIGWGTRSYSKNRPKKDFYFTGIDRKDNNEGYTENNSVPCCKICNYAKMNCTIEQFEQWLIALVQYQTICQSNKKV